jgi:hypothetical protein
VDDWGRLRIENKHFGVMEECCAFKRSFNSFSFRGE